MQCNRLGARQRPLLPCCTPVLPGPDGSVPEELCKLDDALVAEAIKDVLPEGNNISWDDIAGQAEAKRLIQEMVVWPVLNPGLFSVSPSCVPA